jgi:diguanylate cyclase (GGDEF)-like protein
MRPRARLTVPAWVAFLGLGAAALALHLSTLDTSLGDASYNAIPLTCAAVIAIETARRRLRPLAPYVLLTAGLASTGIGEVAWSQLVAAGLEPFPSFVDGLFIAGNIGLVSGLWLRFGRTRVADAAIAVEALILTVGLGLLLWEFAIEPAISDSGDLLTTAIAVTYPATDLLLVGLVARFILLPGQHPLPMWLTVLALGGFLASDLAYSTQLLGDGYVGGLIDVGWLGGYLLLTASVLHPRAADPAGSSGAGNLTSRPRLLVLGASLLVAPGLVAIEELGGTHDNIVVLAIGAAIVSQLVLLRFGMAVRALRGSLDKRRELQVELEHQASHDTLTGLANRALFTNRLQAAVTAGRPVTVLFIDLDDFKAVNDTFGHQEGDVLLAAVAGRIRAALRPGDLPARIGGDEFAILLEGSNDGHSGELVAERLLEVFRQPIDLGAHVATARASIGIATSTGDDAEMIVRNADVAMYLAKEQGRDRYQAFDVRVHEDVLGRLRVRADLERAIDCGELVLHYQPIVDLPTGRIRGTEALVRWQHPEQGLMPPSAFIDVAESTGLIVRLGRWVLNEALTTTRRWQAELGRPDLSVAVNVSARQFEHPGFAAEVAATLAHADLRPECLTLEITESSILDTHATMLMLRDLKQLGVRIAVDDFGTGYSSLSYVGRLPVDVIKIDRSFVAAVSSNSREGALAAAVIRLGEELGLVTVAEGIEDAAQLERLRQLGCNLGQGFYLARPMPMIQATAMLRDEVVPAHLRSPGPSREA